MNVKQKTKALIYLAKEKTIVLYEVGKNPDIPLLAKIIVVIALAYALSPIDLIPDFIPILGYLNDVIILSGLIFIAFDIHPALKDGVDVKNISDECSIDYATACRQFGTLKLSSVQSDKWSYHPFLGIFRSID